MLHQFVVMETEGGWAMGKEDDEQFLRAELAKRTWRSWPSDVEDRDCVLISMLFVAHEREIRSANPPPQPHADRRNRLQDFVGH